MRASTLPTRAMDPAEADDEERRRDRPVEEQLGAAEIAHVAILAVAAAPMGDEQ